MSVSIYEHALLSKHVYQGEKLKPGIQAEFSHWIVLKVYTGKFDYLSILYINLHKRQLVLSHRGTHSLGSLITDLKGVVHNKYTKQQQSSFEATLNAINIAKQLGFSLSFTGHSLGAWHAEQSLFYATYDVGCQDIGAVTFESPGSYEMLSKQLQSNIKQQHHSLNKLNLIECLSYPNAINTFNHHVGTIIHVKPFLFQAHKRPTQLYSLEAHSIENIVEALAEDQPKLYYMLDWPLGIQYLATKNSKFHILHRQSFWTHFRINNDFDPCYDIPIQHFTQQQAVLLQKLDARFNLSTLSSLEKDKLRDDWHELEISPSHISLLLNYKIEEQNQVTWVRVNKHNLTISSFKARLPKDTPPSLTNAFNYTPKVKHVMHNAPY